jgi:poly(A) polymerase
VPAIIPRSDHHLSRANVSKSALKVLYRLKHAGYAAYLVGGGVRDLLLGLHPKDFDIVTDAHPEEVRELFRNSRLIGRRFRLAHVRFGREIVEVATFRATGAGEEDDRLRSDSGRILRDNVYGTIDEDIWRRDFTVNALYYNIADFSILDYTTGFEDIRTRTLRLIGDPYTRYREDPVRMLRAVRLAAKLDFTLDPESEAPIRDLGGLLRDVPAARLFDELLKLFHGGAALKSFELLCRYDLFRYLFPATAEALEAPDAEHASLLVEEGLRNTDDRILSEKPVTPTFLFAVFLWPSIRELASRLEAEGNDRVHALAKASEEVIGAQQSHTSFPRRFSAPMKEILMMQRRFLSRRGVRAQKFLQHKRFRAAYDFLLLRSRCGEVDAEVAEWWTEVQNLSAEEQRKAFAIQRRGRSKRRRGRRNASSQAALDTPR